MANPKEVWTAKLDRTLCTESLGFALCVQLSAPSGLFRFIVRSRQHRAGGPSCVLVVDERPSAMQAMAAAERAAAALAFKQSGRAAPQQARKPARGAAGEGPTPVGAPWGPQRDSEDRGLVVDRRTTLREVWELSGA